MLLLTGYHKLPDHKMYWGAIPDTSCKQDLIQCLIARSNVFFRMLIFVVTNNLINKINSQIGDF